MPWAASGSQFITATFNRNAIGTQSEQQQFFPIPNVWDIKFASCLSNRSPANIGWSTQGHGDMLQTTNDRQTHLPQGGLKDGDRLLTNEETAKIIGVHPKSLVRARIYGGPLSKLPHVSIGRNVRYRLSHVERFLETNTAHTVHERTPG